MQGMARNHMTLNLIGRIAVCWILLTCVGCATRDEPWPQRVTDSLWIPKMAQVEARYYDGSYTCTYTAHVCYPAKDLIDGMVATMKAKGWKRLAYDPFNPSVPLSNTLNRWNRGLDKDYRVGYGWYESWEDLERNIIEYRFEYRRPKRSDFISDKDCSLWGSSSYIPKDVVGAMLQKIKEIEKEMREGKGAPR